MIEIRKMFIVKYDHTFFGAVSNFLDVLMNKKIKFTSDLKIENKNRGRSCKNVFKASHLRQHRSSSCEMGDSDETWAHET